MNEIITLTEIVMRLRPGYSFSLSGENISDIIWLREIPTQISLEEIEEMRKIISSEKKSIEYRYKRLSEYPPIGDQLDDLFKNGCFSEEMSSRIQLIKNKYPK